MKVAYLANSFHISVTHSNDFLSDLLREWYGSVEVIPHKDAWAQIPGSQWDLLVSFQHLWSPEELEAFGAVRTVIVPMYDDCPHDQASWEPYKGFALLSFSQTLGRQLQAWGHEVLTVQYWQPVPQYKLKGHELRGFFWPRTTSLGWGHVRRLLGTTEWESFHLHVTNAEGLASLPSDEERRSLRVEQSSWFEKPVELQNILDRTTVYFAPRRFEGIGQAVLEALARGIAVVAPNTPTMNEYVVHGRNGLLYDPDQPSALDFSRVHELGAQARADAEEGRQRWERSLPTLRAFFEGSPTRRKVHLWIAARGRTIAFLRSVFRRLKKWAGRA